MTAPLLQVRDLTREYQMPREKLFGPPPTVKALNGVSFTIEAGRSLGIVGESGSGKSTLARLVMALDKPTAGSVTMLGRDLHALDAQALRAARRDFQMVFQDPYGSLDPRMTVERIVSEPLAAQGGTDGKLSRADQRDPDPRGVQRADEFGIIRHRRNQDHRIGAMRADPRDYPRRRIAGFELFDHQRRVGLAGLRQAPDQEFAQIGGAGIAVQQGDPALPAGSQAAGGRIGDISQFFDGGLHLLARLLLDVGIVVDHA